MHGLLNQPAWRDAETRTLGYRPDLCWCKLKLISKFLTLIKAKYCFFLFKSKCISNNYIKKTDLFYMTYELFFYNVEL